MKKPLVIALFLFFVSASLLVTNSIISDKVDNWLFGLSTRATTGLGICCALIGILVFLKLSQPRPFAQENLKYYADQSDKGKENKPYSKRKVDRI